MEYTEKSHIKTLKDVEAFFHHLRSERNLSFHPDDIFEDYIDEATNKPMFSEAECALYNRLMDESFTACNKHSADIYELGMKELTKNIYR